jgi:hypothetical protein
VGRKRVAIALLFAALVAAIGTPTPALASTQPHFRSAKDAVAHYGPAARKRLARSFRSAGVAYPPRKLVLAAIKSERVIEVYATRRGALRYVTTYRILGTSGHAGPKLREGDCQIPEGAYRIETLNANTAYHLAMLLDYPNSFDRAQARRDGRSNLGGNINIHGGSHSTGCLSMGDTAAEDLFVLAAATGLDNMKVVIAPSDPRAKPLQARSGAPTWVPALYTTIAREFAKLPRPPARVVANAGSGASAVGASATAGAPASTALAYPSQRAEPLWRVNGILYVLLAGMLLGVAGVTLLFLPVRRTPPSR